MADFSDRVSRHLREEIEWAGESAAYFGVVAGQRFDVFGRCRLCAQTCCQCDETLIGKSFLLAAALQRRGADGR